jgi:hypothetical protein
VCGQREEIPKEVEDSEHDRADQVEQPERKQEEDACD